MSKKKKKFEFGWDFRDWSDKESAMLETIEMAYNQFLPILTTFLVPGGNPIGFVFFIPLIINLKFTKTKDKED